MKKDPEVPMSKWVISVRDLARQIKDLKGDISDEEIIVVLTDSLPDSYTPLVFQLDTMEEKDRTLSHVITQLIEEERRQTEGRDWEDPLALVAAAKRKRKDRSKITCFGCGEKGHYRSECQQEKEELKNPGGGTLYYCCFGYCLPRAKHNNLPPSIRRRLTPSPGTRSTKQAYNT